VKRKNENRNDNSAGGDCTFLPAAYSFRKYPGRHVSATEIGHFIGGFAGYWKEALKSVFSAL